MVEVAALSLILIVLAAAGLRVDLIVVLFILLVGLLAAIELLQRDSR